MCACAHLSWLMCAAQVRGQCAWVGSPFPLDEFQTSALAFPLVNKQLYPLSYLAGPTVGYSWFVLTFENSLVVHWTEFCLKYTLRVLS